MLNQEIDLEALTGEGGYLVDPDGWSEAIAHRLAEKEAIALADGHWEIINWVREWYEDKGVAPSPRDVGLYLKRNKITRAQMHDLFPLGYVQQTCKIAGMKKPRAWSSG